VRSVETKDMTRTSIDHKTERENDLKKIKDSIHKRKIVVAGPGTGKSHMLGELIKDKRKQGKSNFLAITFIGKLGDALADELCGLAKTTTMHSFARSFVLKHCKGWNYYPRMYEIIAEDFKKEGIESFEVGDENYTKKTKYYQAIGDADVVHYAVQICKKDQNKIPTYDLVLVDEYQDFNSIESEFVDLLAQKNEIVIVGDDDQALYAFKGSSPSFIRLKYHDTNTDWESFKLRFCSRCTKVIIKYFHDLVSAFKLNDSTETDPAKKRIEKEFICYLTGSSDGKDTDSSANQKIHLIKNCPVGMIAYKIKGEIEKIAESQKMQDVLVVGEGRSCEALLKTVAHQLNNYGFKNVDYRGDGGIIPLVQNRIDAYKFIAKDESSLLGWRILGDPADEGEKNKHKKNAKTVNTIINGTPSSLAKLSNKNVSILEKDIENWDSDGGDEERKIQNEDIRKSVLISELKKGNLYLPRPICNFDITVCNILNSKGLGADVVFVIGFDQGKFPAKKEVTSSEIYQMLVAITRAKKRVYLINTIGKKVSQFAEHLSADDMEIEEISS
jgi:superfamily I DNA/RNA helicase